MSNKAYLIYEDHSYEVTVGRSIKESLLDHGISPHQCGSQYFHCPSIGTCGTCAISVEGEVTAPTKIEQWRLSFPPHKPENHLRLACQTLVMGDCRVFKHRRFWGNPD